MVGFEPTRRVPDLPHFECGPFNLLGTSPIYVIFPELREQNKQIKILNYLPKYASIPLAIPWASLSW